MVVLLSSCAILWGMVEGVSYAHEIGRLLGIVGFLELFLRGSLILALAVVLAFAILRAQIWRLLRRLLGQGRRADGAPGGES